MRWRISVWIVICSFLSTGVQSQYFQDITDSSGLEEFHCDCILGRGYSFADFDGDDWPDLTFATPQGDSIYFYKNVGGTFERVFLPIGDTSDLKALYWADFDNDGDKDLITGNRDSRNRLYRCDGPGVYVDVTDSSGLLDVDDRTYGMAIADVDNDGLLDLAVANYQYEDHKNYLYINTGGMTFEERSDDYNLSGEMNLTFLPVFVDFDRDGYQDLYWINDRYDAANKLFRNIGGNIFADSTDGSGADVVIDAMDGGIGDYNEDGYMDVYISNTPSDGNILLKNNGDFTFEDVTGEAGVGFYRIGWGGTFFDIDNDKDYDLHACGLEWYPDDPNAMYINQGPPEYDFIEENIPNDTSSTYVDGIADFNRDGKVDFVLYNNTGFRAQVFKNISDQSNHWVQFKLKGTESNRDGTGSQLECFSAGRRMSEYANCGESFLVQNTFVQHFGLGQDSVADTLIVYWPSGIRDSITEIEADQCYTVIENCTHADSIMLSGEVGTLDGEGLDSVHLAFTGDMNTETFTNDTE